MELDINDVNTVLYVCTKVIKSKLRVKPKKKKKPDKYKTPMSKINVQKEIETMRREMSILSEKKGIKIQKQKKPGRL